MRTPWLLYGVLCSSLLFGACAKNGENGAPKPQCSDGIDNDGDGLVDFPDDPGCVGPNDDSEDSLPSPQCSDGRDNDGDGKIDFPNDPGCYAPQQDSEIDDCPDGPNCPQCANGKDDDGNGLIDYPDDPGCTSAADNDEFTDNPAACGNNITLLPVPFDGHITGMLTLGAPSTLSSPTCGGTGGEDVYELRIMSPKVVSVTTDLPGTSVDTVLYIRGADCTNPTSELGCNDDAPMPTVMGSSTLNVSIATPGVYYLIVDAHDSGTGGTYEMQVNLLAGEGEPCDSPTSCGTGLVCRIPLGMTQKVCAKHVCSDGVDDDGDGKLDYPTDPGCTSPDDDDESDPCPGPGCPECADGIDNDHDGKIDYPNDPTCTSAADASESCPSTDGVTTITTPTKMGDTTAAHNDVVLTCGDSASTAPDQTYRIDLPAMQTLTINTNPNFDAVTALFGASCVGTPVGGATVGCQDTSDITETGLAAGSYYIVVDGYFDGEAGTYTLTISGKISPNGSCEGPLATSGAITCADGSSCAGTAGSRTCHPVACSDGIDNDADGKIDYPWDPGCTSPTDTSEANASNTVCSDNVDNDGDGTKDFPADIGCSSAADTSEVFCATEHDAHVPINSGTMTGTTAGKANDEAPIAGCTSSSSAPDVVYSLFLPVPVQSLQIDTIGSSFDTALSFVDTHCANTISCNDDGGGGLTSEINLGNVAAGNYAVVVDGYNTNSGAFKVHTLGIVAPGTACTAAGFGGATPYLKCPAGTACTGGTCH